MNITDEQLDERARAIADGSGYYSDAYAAKYQAELSALEVDRESLRLLECTRALDMILSTRFRVEIDTHITTLRKRLGLEP